jgi:6-phosphogluconolactonase
MTSIHSTRVSRPIVRRALFRRPMLRRLVPLVVAALAAGSLPAAAAERHVWFGTGTRGESKSEGIYVATFDTTTGALSAPRLAAQASNPSFLALHPSLPVLYAVAEVPDVEGRPGGGVSAFAIDDATGGLTLLNSQSSGGAGPCHVTVDAAGRVALAANYGGGSAICLRLAADGRLEPVSAGSPGGFVQHAYEREPGPGFNAGRQEKPHAHSINPAPDGRFAVVCDLGLDKVFVHALDTAKGVLAPHTAAVLPAGAGPRHFAFHPSGRFGYAVNELDLTVTALAFDGQAGTLTPVEAVSTLPADVTERAGFSTAEVVVHPTGRFVYASNRGHDSIAQYEVDGTTGRLRFRGVEPIRGKTPRNFVLAPGGRFLLAAGQGSDTVTVFAIDEATGGLTFTGTSIIVPTPMCIRFRP